MKGLRKYLTPFAPDQSGAVSVLFEMGGIIVICDAGGCAGNVCGFDEPRWFSKRSAIFSAGLRDMDAILGRDDRLVAKLLQAVEKIDAKFIAIIGTPVPAVIGTDYHALKRMLERKTELPVITVDANGMELYETGEEKAWLALFRQFAVAKEPAVKGRVGVLGATPLALSDLNAAAKLKSLLVTRNESAINQKLLTNREAATGVSENIQDSLQKWPQEIYDILCYGMGAGLEVVQKAATAEWNLVVSPSALAAAEYLNKTFGTPYRVECPLAEEFIPQEDFLNKRVLILHQQVMANSLRELLKRQGYGENITVATWFTLKRQLARPQDILLKEEDQLQKLVEQGKFDYIFGDSCFQPIVPQFKGQWVAVPHFAASGQLIEH